MLWKVPSEAATIELVAGIERADEAAIIEFYNQYARWLKTFMLYRGMRSDAEDMAMDTICTVITQLQRGMLRNPAALPGYVRSVALRRVYQKRTEWSCAKAIPIEAFPLFSVQSGMDPEEQMMAQEKDDILRKALKQLKPARAELLKRFYLDGQKQPQIERELGLNSTQFRLHKNRSKDKLIRKARKIAAGGRQGNIKKLLEKPSCKAA